MYTHDKLPTKPEVTSISSEDFYDYFSVGRSIPQKPIDQFIHTIDKSIDEGQDPASLSETLLPLIQTGVIRAYCWSSQLNHSNIMQVLKKLNIKENFFDDHHLLDRQKIWGSDRKLVPFRDIINNSLIEDLNKFFYQSNLVQLDDKNFPLVLNAQEQVDELLSTIKSYSDIGFSLDGSKYPHNGGLEKSFQYAIGRGIKGVLLEEQDHFDHTVVQFDARKYLETVLLPKIQLGQKLGFSIEFENDLIDLDKGTFGRKWLKTNSPYSVDPTIQVENLSRGLQKLAEVTVFMEKNKIPMNRHRISDSSRSLSNAITSLYEHRQIQDITNFNTEELLKFAIGQNRLAMHWDTAWSSLVNSIIDASKHWSMDTNKLLAFSRQAIMENLLSDDYDLHDYRAFASGVSNFTNVVGNLSPEVRNEIFSQDFVSDPDRKKQVMDRTSSYHKHLYKYRRGNEEKLFATSLDSLYKSFKLSPQELQSFINSELINYDVSRFLEFHSSLSPDLLNAIFTHDFLEEESVRKTMMSKANNYVEDLFKRSDANAVLKLKMFCELANLSTESTNKIFLNAYFQALARKNVLVLTAIKTEFPVKDMNFDELARNTPAYISSLMTNFGMNSFSDIENFFNENNEYCLLLCKTPDVPSSLDLDDIALLNSIHLDIIEAELVKRDGLNLTSIKSDKDYQSVFEILKKKAPGWQDSIITDPFEKGSQIFGYKRMFSYIDRRKLGPVTHKPTIYLELTRHDTLLAFTRILELFKVSGLTPDQFYGNILNQVRLDTGEYEDGSSYHHLNSLAQTTNIDLQEILAKAAQHPDIPAIRDFLTQFNTPQAVFSSWTTFKVFADRLAEVFENPEFLDELQLLHSSGKDKLANYAEALMFHKTSKIEAKAIKQFIEDPYGFLAEISSDTPQEVHDRKKPSNYIDIPNLGLTAIELRDALVEGKMDSLQVFSPLEIRYTVPLENGNGKTPFEQKTQTIIAKIHLKSSAESAIAGSDTVNCMPFGDGKNTLYMFNPNVAMFTIQIERPDGSRRTIAQSVLTKDKNIGVPVSTVIKAMQSDDTHLSNILPENIVRQGNAFLSCDNIEVAPNYQKEQTKKVLKGIYKDFFREYMLRYALTQHLNPTRVPVGLGYSDALTDLPKESNTYIPQAPVSYSDKLHDEIYMLKLDDESLNIDLLSREVKVPDSKDAEKPEFLPSSKGISLLTYEDALSVGYLEGKAYAGTTLIQYLHNMENALIAKDINNAVKGRSNMSLKAVDEDGRVRGYMLAYEGEVDDEALINYDSELEGQRMIYVSDIASDLEQKGTGLTLLGGFMELYLKNYLQNGDSVPIFAQMREKTSYRYVQMGLGRLMERLGVKGVDFQIEELPTYDAGDDVMHPVIIRPIKAK